MENGKFTQKERVYLASLEAVEKVFATHLVYSTRFKREYMQRYYAGESPGAIFASAGISGKPYQLQPHLSARNL